MRARLRTGSSALWLTTMFLGALTLWIGVPIAWLWIGSKVQQATDSVGAAIAAMLPGAIVTIALLVPVLGRLNEHYEHTREARGLENFGQAPLEAVLVVSATVALVVFAVWFFFLSGTAPNPIPGTNG
jgi:hypothetical protein